MPNAICNIILHLQQRKIEFLTNCMRSVFVHQNLHHCVSFAFTQRRLLDNTCVLTEWEAPDEEMFGPFMSVHQNIEPNIFPFDPTQHCYKASYQMTASPFLSSCRSHAPASGFPRLYSRQYLHLSFIFEKKKRAQNSRGRMIMDVQIAL